jgi:hypothetical protein
LRERIAPVSATRGRGCGEDGGARGDLKTRRDGLRALFGARATNIQALGLSSRRRCRAVRGLKLESADVCASLPSSMASRRVNLNRRRFEQPDFASRSSSRQRVKQFLAWVLCSRTCADSTLDMPQGSTSVIIVSLTRESWYLALESKRPVDVSVRAAQQMLPFRYWGGARRGAGRKRIGVIPRVPHGVRAVHRAERPVHVTIRVRYGVLQTQAVFPAVRAVLRAINQRAPDGFRVAEFSVQSNHSGGQ